MSSVNQVLIEIQGSVGIVNFQTDKLNVLSHALRADLYQALQQLLANDAVESIVLAGSAKAFSAGADIAEFSAGTHLNFPSLHDLVNTISDAAKPVIAVISGTALGGGLELALACHHRVIHEKAQLALPEVHLGLLPGAATLDFAQGFAKEQALFQQLAASDVSKSLRHAFFAEREVKNIPGLEATAKAKNIEKVAVIGAGTMGSGIAICFLQAGYPVTLIENQQAGLDRGLSLISKHFAGQVAKGRLTEEKAQAIQVNLSTSLEYSALENVDLALEAVFEDWDVKTAVLKQMDQYLPAHAVLASNTSTLDLNLLAQQTSRPASVVGLHFFSPAQIMPLLEVIRTNATDDATLVTALEIGKRLRKVAVVAGVCDGFIGNRMLNEYLRIAGLLIDAGASPYQIDTALENWGMAMGPFRMCDMAGNDIGYLIRKQQLKVNPDKKFSGIADQLVEAKRLGQKTQKGWYDYSNGNRRGDQDADVLAMIDAYRAEKGIQVRSFSDEEIVERCIYALANEGFRLLEEGIAIRRSDIDVVYLAGYGFPRWRGGPMFYAAEQGLDHMAAAMQQFAQDPYSDAEFWQVPALLAESLTA